MNFRVFKSTLLISFLIFNHNGAASDNPNNKPIFLPSSNLSEEEKNNLNDTCQSIWALLDKPGEHETIYGILMSLEAKELLYLFKQKKTNNPYGNTLLLDLVIYENQNKMDVEIVQTCLDILKRGPSYSEIKDLLLQENINGDIPLTIAACYNNVEMAEVLLDPFPLSERHKCLTHRNAQLASALTAACTFYDKGEKEMFDVLLSGLDSKQCAQVFSCLDKKHNRSLLHDILQSKGDPWKAYLFQKLEQKEKEDISDQIQKAALPFMLIRQIEDDNIYVVKGLLKGLDSKQIYKIIMMTLSPSQDTPLSKAIKMRREWIIYELLKRLDNEDKQNILNRDISFPWWLIEFGKRDFIRLLFMKDDNTVDSEQKYLFLISQNPNEYSPLMQAVLSDNNYGIIDELSSGIAKDVWYNLLYTSTSEEKGRETALFLAINRLDDAIKVIKVLLKDMNEDQIMNLWNYPTTCGNTAFSEAIAKGKVQEVELFLKSIKYNLDRKRILLKRKHNEANTPLILSALAGSFQIMNLLLKDIPLEDWVKMLEAQNDKGETSLIAAIKYHPDNPKLVELLLQIVFKEEGDYDDRIRNMLLLKDKAGKTALDYPMHSATKEALKSCVDIMRMKDSFPSLYEENASTEH